MNNVFIIFPNQLFKNIEILKSSSKVFLIEEYLFFKQYKFHKQKLVLHRASMLFYKEYLQEKNVSVEYIEAINENCKIENLINSIAKDDITNINIYEASDNWLEKKIKNSCLKNNIKIITHNNLSFINSVEDIEIYFKDRVKYFQTDFYIFQRKKLNILLETATKPIGGKWSFDIDNREKYPKEKTPPKVNFPSINSYFKEAIEYVDKHFANNYGEISPSFIYPTTFIESENWLKDFLVNRFSDFGLYEDAIVDKENILNHSVLTPMLNIGLLTPKQIVDAAIEYGTKNNLPLNSIEGFIRQVIGWREFIRAVYLKKGSEERTRNYWKFNHKIPNSFYTGTTGIKPIDDVIKKVIKTGYCHHIERLMILGNFMLLCNFHPNEVYKWFMEMFIDAYDWVMVPNVYGMSQFADGGLFATKPYISGSSYVLKMSNYKKENWCQIWDALFWNFMNVHRDFFSKNPRLGMLIKTFDKMDIDKQKLIKKTANEFINELVNKK